MAKIIQMDEILFDTSFHVFNTDEDVQHNGWTQVHKFIEENIGENSFEFYHNTERGGYATQRLDGFYAVEERDNWLFISRGFTESSILKVTHDPSVSGLGFELVVRVAKNKSKPHQWVANLFATVLEYSHRECVNHEDIIGPVVIDNVPFTEILVLRDFIWNKPIETEFGRVEFYQLVLLHSDEAEQALEVGPMLYTKWLFQLCVPCNDPLRTLCIADHLLENIKKSIIPNDNIVVREIGINQQWFMTKQDLFDIMLSMLQFRPYITKTLVFYPIGISPEKQYENHTSVFIGGALYSSLLEFYRRVGTFIISQDPDIVITLSDY